MMNRLSVKWYAVNGTIVPLQNSTDATPTPSIESKRRYEMRVGLPESAMKVPLFECGFFDLFLKALSPDQDRLLFLYLPAFPSIVSRGTSVTLNSLHPSSVAAS